MRAFGRKEMTGRKLFERAFFRQGDPVMQILLNGLLRNGVRRFVPLSKPFDPREGAIIHVASAWLPVNLRFMKTRVKQRAQTTCLAISASSILGKPRKGASKRQALGEGLDACEAGLKQQQQLVRIKFVESRGRSCRGRLLEDLSRETASMRLRCRPAL